MWISHTLVLASLLMMFIPESTSKPQGEIPVTEISLPKDDKEFLNLLGPGAGQESATCKCVPFNSCCDKNNDAATDSDTATDSNGSTNSDAAAPDLDENLITLKHTVNAEQHKKGSCEEILQVCCDDVCKSPKSLRPGAPAQPNQCGIRNANGIGMEVTGFEDRQAQLSEFPWMVALLDKDDNYVAGGSLIHRRVVLTAGHKVYNLDPSNLVARMGDYDLNSTSEPIPTQTINVAKIVYHENFQRPTLVNNVALLILENDVTFSDVVMPICMPKSGETFDGAEWNRAECIVTGWGKDVFGRSGRYQTIMKKVTVPVVNHTQCQHMLQQTRLGSTFELHESFNCAGGKGEDSCTGDGGSPLVCLNPKNPTEYVQMGVVAWGIGCGIVGNPGVYGSIPKTQEWIMKTIKAEFPDFDERDG